MDAGALILWSVIGIVTLMDWQAGLGLVCGILAVKLITFLIYTWQYRHSWQGTIHEDPEIEKARKVFLEYLNEPTKK